MDCLNVPWTEPIQQNGKYLFKYFQIFVVGCLTVHVSGWILRLQVYCIYSISKLQIVRCKHLLHSRIVVSIVIWHQHFTNESYRTLPQSNEDNPSLLCDSTYQTVRQRNTEYYQSPTKTANSLDKRAGRVPGSDEQASSGSEVPYTRSIRIHLLS